MMQQNVPAFARKQAKVMIDMTMWALPGHASALKDPPKTQVDAWFVSEEAGQGESGRQSLTFEWADPQVPKAEFGKVKLVYGVVESGTHFHVCWQGYRFPQVHLEIHGMK